MRILVHTALAALGVVCASCVDAAAETVTLQALGDVHPGAVRLGSDALETAVSHSPTYTKASSLEPPIQNRTSVDHRFTQDGLTGSAGYLCGLSGIGPDTDAPRGGPASAFSHFGTFLGATLAYPLRW